MSQYDVREAAVLRPANVQTEHFYSVGLNDQIASRTLRLNPIEYDWGQVGSTNSTEDYLAWIKQMTRSGYAPTITVYMNHFLFYHSNDPNDGYHEYPKASFPNYSCLLLTLSSSQFVTTFIFEKKKEEVIIKRSSFLDPQSGTTTSYRSQELSQTSTTIYFTRMTCSYSAIMVSTQASTGSLPSTATTTATCTTSLLVTARDHAPRPTTLTVILKNPGT